MSSPNLNDLKDVMEPAAPSWFPLASGLVFWLIIAAWLVACTAWFFYGRYKAGAYRRAALDLMSEAETRHDVSVLLKRVALVAYQREQVASLYGEEWVEFLETSCKGVQLSELLDGADESATQSLRQQATQWIKGHEC